MTSTVGQEISAAASRVRLAIFDVDGVLTDGQLILGPDGGEFKSFNVRDGHGLVMLRDSGVAVAIITGRESSVVARRMRELGIEYVYQGQRDKLVALRSLLDTSGVQEAAVCYVGDDLPDVPVMQRVGLPVAVADAHWKVAQTALWQTRAAGGRGAVREVCELIMRAQDTLDTQIGKYDTVAS